MIKKLLKKAAPSDTSINVTIPLRVENPNWTGANFTSVDMDISFLTSSVSKSSDRKYQILGARTDNIWHNITAMLSFNNSESFCNEFQRSIWIFLDIKIA